MIEIYLLPFTLFKYLLAGVGWILLIQFILQSDIYYETRDWISNKYHDYKEKKSPHIPNKKK
mgnify:FL=1